MWLGKNHSQITEYNAKEEKELAEQQERNLRELLDRID